ncbi:MAG: glycosyltransferase [Vicinamibacterales bacterium]
MSVEFSVVIPVLDMADSIGPCLDALLRQSLPADRFEILVVDNGSSDGTPDVVRRYPVRLLHEPVAGACNARNRGIREASGTFIAMTDADCVPSRCWLASLAQASARGDHDIIAGPLAVLDPDASLFSRYSATIGQYNPERTLAHPSFPYAVTGNVCIRRGLFDEVGLLNPSFPTYDGAEFFWRAAQRGPLRATVARRALVFYRTRSSLGAFLRQNFGYGLGTGRLMRHASSENRAALSRAAVRLWRSRLADASTFLRALPASRSVPLALLHALRETAVTAGVLTAVLGGHP